MAPGASGGPNTTTSAQYYARRARTRAPRLIRSLRTPVSFGLSQHPRKEDRTDLRNDVLGPLIRQHYPVVQDGSRASLFAAFDKRCNHFDGRRVHPSLLAANAALLDKVSPTHWDPLVYDRDLFEAWCLQFPAAKQARYRKAYENVSACTQQQFSDKEIFAKVEALLKRHDPDWAPRVVYQSSDLHNVLCGPVMWQCSKRMFSAFKRDCDAQVSYMGAYREQTPALVEHITAAAKSDSFYIESDFSSNDMTQVADVHALEVAWLTRFGAPRWLTALMLVANSFKASSRKHKIKASIRNQLPSGSQSTTFRNSMWNSTINYAFALRANLSGRVLILGDDMLMRVDSVRRSWRPRDYRRCYEDTCRRACMRATVVVNGYLEECTFLSKHFVSTGTGSYVMLPFFGKAMARFNVRASSNEAVSDRAYLCGKALSYAYEFRFCRGLRLKFMRRFKQLYLPDEDISTEALGWNARGAFLDLGVEGVAEHVLDPGVEVDRDAFNIFWHTRYGLTYSDVMDLAERFLFGSTDLDVDGLGFLCSDFL